MRWVENTVKLKLWILVDKEVMVDGLAELFAEKGGAYVEWFASTFSATVASFASRGYRAEVTKPFPRWHAPEFIDQAAVQHLKNMTNARKQAISYTDSPRTQRVNYRVDSEADYARLFNQWIGCESIGVLSYWLGIGDAKTMDTEAGRISYTPAVYLSVIDDLPEEIARKVSERVIVVRKSDIPEGATPVDILTIFSKTLGG